MASRGRPRKPTALKLLDGTFRADRHGSEPVISSLAELPRAPASLGKHGKAKWKIDGARLIELGVLTLADLSALESYCAIYDEVASYSATLESQGEYTMRENGSVSAHPALRFRAEALTRIRVYQREFGLTPSSRTGVAAKTDKPLGGRVAARKRG